MATGFTKNFVVKNGITTGPITLDAGTGNITGTNLSVTGLSDLGAIANVIITGGSNGQSIITDGNGNLSFASASADSNPAPMPIVIDEGNTLTISANYQGLFGYPLTIDGTLTVDGVLIDVNDNGNGGGGGGGTATALNANIANVSIYGGSSGYYLQTDGAGTLSWAAGGGGGGGSPGGVTTQVQFNDAGSFAGNTGFTFNKTTGIFTAPYLSGNGNGLSNIQGANVSGAVGLATYAGTANAVALANVSGAGNIASINLDGSSSNVLYGNGVFAPASGGGSYGNSNVATFLTSYGSNTITTTGNVSVGNIIGNGQALTGIAGANVTGQVSYAATANSVAGANVSGTVTSATTAGTVTTAAQPNITSTGTLASLSVTANANIGNIGTAGIITATGNITGGNISGTLLTGTLTTASQPNITSVGTLTSLTVSGTSNLGAIGNVTVTGGTNGQYLTTNGSGTLSWTTPLTTSIVSGTTQTAVQNYRYVLSNTSATTVTLPSSPTLGDTVYIVVANDLLTNIVARNGQKIMSLDQDMTINSSNAAFGLLYTNSTLGWRVI